MNIPKTKGELLGSMLARLLEIPLLTCVSCNEKPSVNWWCCRSTRLTAQCRAEQQESKKPNHEDSEKYPASLWSDRCVATWSSTCADKWSMLPLGLFFFCLQRISVCWGLVFYTNTSYTPTGSRYMPGMHRSCTAGLKRACAQRLNCWHWSVELMGCREQYFHRQGKITSLP